MNRDSGRVRIRGPGSREPRRKSVAARRHRSFAQGKIMPLVGAETKTGPLCSSHLHKGPALSYLAGYRTAAKDASNPLERFRFASGVRPGGAISQSRIRLLL